MQKTITTIALSILYTISLAQKLPLKIESIWNGYFDEKKLQPHILHTRPAVAFIRADRETNFEGILTLDMVTGKIIDTIFTNQTKVTGDETPITFTFFEDFDFSPDDSKFLIKTERQAVYHASFKEFIYVWDDVKKTLKPITTDGKISYTTFSPNGKLVSYIRDGNIYFKNIESGKITAVTSDGVAGSIINGMADEVYEDGFGIGQMYQWSPDGNKIAFIKLNQNFVKKIPLTTYEKNEPVIQQKVYAKPGEAITEAGLFIYDIKNNAYSKLDLGNNSNQYILNFKWQPNGASILVERLNRAQKKMDILQCNANNGSYIKTVYSEVKPDYITVVPNNMYMHPNQSSFFWQSGKTGYNHIYEINYTTDSEKAITQGEWDVIDYKGYDAKRDRIYYTANMNDNKQSQLFSASTNGNNPIKLTLTRGTHEVHISDDFAYFFDHVSTINSPSVYRIYKTNGAEVTNKAIIENKKFKDNIQPYDVNDASFFSFKNKNNAVVNGWVITGEKNGQRNKKRHLILYVYGAHNKREVLDEWNDRASMTWRYFVNMGYTVACIDPSGTPGNGEAFKKITYNNLTNGAVDDITTAKEYLIRNFNIDANNTTLMGWSYGGYLASLFATKYAGSFNTYIAIAPVTDWRSYGVAYTERLLGMPSDNPELYKNLMPETYVSDYKGGLLLLHGTADDNVYVQNTLKLAKALTEVDANYDIQMFTDKGHTLSDGMVDKTRMNLYRMIYKFLQRNKN